MSWFWLALGGHVANAIAFLIDKVLLNKGFKRSATYAGLIGLLSVLTILAAPWMEAWPRLTSLPVIAGFGSLFVLALWSFFEALRRAEATRVVPIIGSLIPIITFAGTAIFLGERFSSATWLGFVCLLLATVILSSGGSKTTTLKPATFGFAVLSACLFAAASVCGKIAFTQAPFLTVFISSRLIAAITAALILLIDKKARVELISIFSGKKQAQQAGGLAIFGQVCGSLGFILVNAALAQGSAPIVNALQAVQYGLIALVGWFGGSRLTTLLTESQDRKTRWLKVLALALVAIGLYSIAGDIGLV